MVRFGRRFGAIESAWRQSHPDAIYHKNEPEAGGELIVSLLGRPFTHTSFVRRV